ncbi:MAG TPA: rRNA maturation RNase YbeY [Steroidobacteraceae bacterium]|nr:rRNA maturation RNase YbeY [Steroidobacteraceae bacterium]
MSAGVVASPPLRVEVQYAARRPWVPSATAMRRWARVAHSVAARGARPRAVGRGTAALICIRIAGPGESRRINREFRDQDRPTNVLSFPASTEEAGATGALGDLVISAPVVAREAREQGKTLAAHWAHMVVHGTLHLLGHDHERPGQARRMERLEVEILAGLGYQNPYVASAAGTR